MSSWIRVRVDGIRAPDDLATAHDQRAAGQVACRGRLARKLERNSHEIVVIHPVASGFSSGSLSAHSVSGMFAWTDQEIYTASTAAARVDRTTEQFLVFNAPAEFMRESR